MPESVLGRSLLWIGVFNLIVGYLSAIWLGAAACARRGQRLLSAHAILMPLYWLAISLAAYRALWQLARAPFYWEKTEHFSQPDSSIPGQSVPAKGV
jgi:ABC-type dipeptide/oligopeptide/nickel transport system permease component